MWSFEALGRTRLQALAPMAVIDAHGLGRGGPHEAPHGFAQSLALDAPERDVDCGERGHQHETVAVSRKLVVVPVPVIFDAACVLPHQKGVNHWIAFSTISTRPEMEPSPRPVMPPAVSTSRETGSRGFGSSAFLCRKSVIA